MSNKNQNTWMFANYDDSDHWRFADSRDEALAEAKAMSDEDELDEFVIARAKLQPPIPATIAEELLERMDERWAEETGSDDYMFEKVTQKQKDDLDTAIQGVFDTWLKKTNYKMRDWYQAYQDERFTRNHAASEWLPMA